MINIAACDYTMVCKTTGYKLTDVIIDGDSRKNFTLAGYSSLRLFEIRVVMSSTP